ncbi:MAG TPA: 2-oxoacid:acceptor oxidoreductase family protein [Acidimicrobiales bacterium]|nr:2-oxoacid:acceptor oxidoreductase family protein [Acidimicrobiales bacterium]
MSWRVDVRCAGSGGQGLALAAVVLAEAGLAAGCQVALTQEYGPEARGGASRADVAISDEVIANPQCGVPSILLALHDKAWRKFATAVPAVSAALESGSAAAVVDRDLVAVEPGTPGVLALPFEAVARDELRAKVVANMVAVGALGRLMGRFGSEVVESAVATRSPSAFRQLNVVAFRRGWAMMDDLAPQAPAGEVDGRASAPRA